MIFNSACHGALFFSIGVGLIFHEIGCSFFSYFLDSQDLLIEGLFFSCIYIHNSRLNGIFNTADKIVTTASYNSELQ